MADEAPPIGIIMGSQSDWETMRHAAGMLDALQVRYETRIVSAHRTPDRLYAYAKGAAERGLKVIIAGAGGAAHLPGMTASMTRLPVLGVPVESKALSGLDSLLSIVQMPSGIPVGTLAIGKAGAANAGLLAAAPVIAGAAVVALATVLDAVVASNPRLLFRLFLPLGFVLTFLGIEASRRGRPGATILSALGLLCVVVGAAFSVWALLGAD